MRHLIKHLRTYINHYSKCELNQIKRYKSYENIIFIEKSKISFYIIIMNFIITLLIIINEYDYLLIIINEYDYFLIITNKFFKRVLIILEKTIYIVAK